MNPNATELIALTLFVIAVTHTFSTKYFEHRARLSADHQGFWHLLGEVEVVFGLWAFVLFALLALAGDLSSAIAYIDSRNFTEPLFVFAIMAVAATRPILESTSAIILRIGKALSAKTMLGTYAATLCLIPLLGSFITEPAAMTLAAIIIGQQFFARGVSLRFKYATLAVLFVNVSVGGTLTNFAAPPVLMVSSTWGWDTLFMLQHFGWKSMVVVFVNTLGAAWLFRRELMRLPPEEVAPTAARPAIPLPMVLLHLGFLGGIVAFAHHPPIFLGILLFFLGVAHAYPRYQQRLILKEALLVGFFLGGLVVLGGLQEWWLKPLLMRLDSNSVFVGALGLTAFTDNAALTYLGSLVDGLSSDFQYALVAGAVAGGGLTIIANAPNPAGISILRRHFDKQSISPSRLFVAALAPTWVAGMAFWWL
ncbi:putative Na+/H+ antiporter [uncultured Propionivibrio sp.]|uniref:putative Na+/H+ antiporter n=1 Tax=uncultured Propionivibrio sp. TaxID=426737 RepID=UPI0029C0B5C1|nr:putative Na+/H+ antiporter [uncultured Propionivibrio sp.]